jgi:aspartate oxidase
METLKTDVLVIGSGIAGLWFAYKIADFYEVILITKKESSESNTNYAQGGIAAAIGEDDALSFITKILSKPAKDWRKKRLLKLFVKKVQDWFMSYII